MEESLLECQQNVNKNKKPDVYKPIDVYSVIYSTDESVSSISMRNILNQLSKHDLSWRLAMNNLKGKKLFPHQMNTYYLDLVLVGVTGIIAS